MNYNKPIGSLRVGALHETAAVALRSMIITGQLAPGASIDEKKLCEELDISRTPLREAIKTISTEGLITLQARRGASVTPIVADELYEKLELVRLLEDYAVKLVCLRAADEQFVELKAIFKQVVEAFNSLNDISFLAKNDQFHRALIKASGNKSLVDAHESPWLHLTRARYLILREQRMTKEWVQALKKLMKAIEKRDEASAVSQMEARWAISKEMIEKLFD